ncbi:MAG: response regulator, partial [Candidatus Thermoplasmatota archaeon]|nr:response regulator [Candidatus Thermoplasmatota archaeon]
YHVSPFSSGDALLEGLSEGTPDLILLDINMPGHSGWEVRGMLKDRQDTANVPVIAVTAQGGSSIEQSARETLEFTDYLRKPFKMADLWNTVETALTQA